MQREPLTYAAVIIKLLQGVIYSDDPHWQELQTKLTPIKEYFHKIGLEVRNYDLEGFAYLEQPDPDPDDKFEPLPRLTKRRGLRLDVTIFCVLLRQALGEFDASDATGRLVLNIEKIRDLLKPYLPAGNNEEKFRREVDGLVNKVEELGFLRQLSGQEENYEVRPILKAKIDADTLTRLKEKLEKYATPAAN